MSIVRREVEVTVRIGHEPTEMSAVGIIAWHPDIEVLAMRSYCDHDGVVLLLVTTNPQKATHVLEAAGFRCKANPVIMVGPLQQSGLVARIGAELAFSGIEVLYSYASRVGDGHHHLVFKTAEDDRALQALDGSASIREVAGRKSWPEQNAAPGVGTAWQSAAA